MASRTFRPSRLGRGGRSLLVWHALALAGQIAIEPIVHGFQRQQTSVGL